MASRETVMNIPVDEVIIGEGRRQVDEDAVKRIAQAIREVGLQHPITVRSVSGQFLLIAGAHRLAAYRKLGEDHILASVVKMDDEEAEMWEISENLHRFEYATKLERDVAVARWIELRELRRVSLQNEAKGTGRPESGVRAAARELGIEQADAHRAVQVASLTPEAKAAARETGLDDNRGDMLRAARIEPSQQADAIRDMADRRASKIDADVRGRAAQEAAEIIAEYVPADAWDGLKANLYAAGANAIANALTNITGQSVMDRRYGS
jgi:ParB-like chromosome segregation protein Spo0J